MGDIMSESMGGIISECPGDFIGIGKVIRTAPSLVLMVLPSFVTRSWVRVYMAPIY